MLKKANGTIGSRFRGRNTRLLAPLGVGVFVMVGTLSLLGNADSSTTEGTLVPTLVAARAIPASTPVAELGQFTEIRDLPESARATGALGSTADVPSELADGVVARELVPGQQVLSSSIAADPIAAVADDYVAVSVRLEPQRWVGPYQTTGATVAVYQIGETGSRAIVDEARIVLSPDPNGLDPKSEAVITLAVPGNRVADVVAAAATGKLWLVGR